MKEYFENNEVTPVCDSTSRFVNGAIWRAEKWLCECGTELNKGEKECPWCGKKVNWNGL